jgi:ribokinase
VVATAQAIEGHPDTQVDVLVRSAADTQHAALVAPLVVATDGARGGTWTAADGTSGHWDPAPLPGPVVDEFGAGDAFVSGLTLALAAQRPLEEALAYAARAGALVLTGRGPYGADLSTLGRCRPGVA